MESTGAVIGPHWERFANPGDLVRVTAQFGCELVEGEHPMEPVPQRIEPGERVKVRAKAPIWLRALPERGRGRVSVRIGEDPR